MQLLIDIDQGGGGFFKGNFSVGMQEEINQSNVNYLYFR